MATLADLRRDVGRNTRSLLVTRPTITGTSGGESDTLSAPASFISTANAGDYAYYKGQTSRVQGFSAADSELVLVDPLTSAVDGEEVELWSGRWEPEEINQFINQALLDVRGEIYDPATPLVQCVDARNRVIDLPSDWTMIQDLFYRQSLSYVQVSDFKPFEHTSDTDQESEYDYQDLHYSPAIRIDTIESNTLSADTFESEIGPVDLSSMTHLETWVKVVGEPTTITLKLRSDGTDVYSEDLDLTQREWEYLQLSLPAPEKLRSVDEIALTFTHSATTTSDGMIFWLNGLWAVDYDSILWRVYSREKWRQYQQERSVNIIPMYASSLGTVGGGIYGGTPFGSLNWGLPIQQVLEIHGGKDPGPLSDDDDETNVDPWFVVCRATELAFDRASGGRQTDPENFRQQTTYWAARAAEARNGFPVLTNIRRLART